MRNAQFTSEPWTIEEIEYRGRPYWNIRGPLKTGDQIVARVNFEQDASLIVAAPELFDICLDLSRLQDDGAFGEHGRFPAFEAIKEILAKVTGKCSI